MPEEPITEADIERMQRGFGLDILAYQVYAVRDGIVVRIAGFADEAEARAAAGLGQNASS